MWRFVPRRPYLYSRVRTSVWSLSDSTKDSGVFNDARSAIQQGDAGALSPGSTDHATGLHSDHISKRILRPSCPLDAFLQYTGHTLKSHKRSAHSSSFQFDWTPPAKTHVGDVVSTSRQMPANCDNTPRGDHPSTCSVTTAVSRSVPRLHQFRRLRSPQVVNAQLDSQQSPPARGSP